MEFVLKILLFEHLYSENHKTHDKPSCFRIEIEKSSKLFFQTAFERKW